MKWRKHKETLSEFYRLYFHSYLITLIVAFQIFILVPSAIISYIELMGVKPIELPHIRMYEIDWWLLLLMFNLPLFTWLYSTVAEPIKRGYKYLIDWKKTHAGRITSAAIHGTTFFILFIVLGSRYAKENYTGFFQNVQLPKENFGFLIVTNMNSFIYLLYVTPILIALFVIFQISRRTMKFEDLRKDFFKWEFPLLARHSYSLRDKACDVIVGWEKDTKKPIILREAARFLHELIIGATGSGKTSTAILPRVAQDLVRIAQGQKLSVVILEPKGDLVEDTLKMARKLGIPESKILVIDPAEGMGNIKFNPFFGPLEEAAEGFRGVLDSLTGDQDEFFRGQQGETAALFTMLAKLRYRDLANVTHVQRMYSDPRYLANMAEEVRSEITNALKKPDLSDPQKRDLAQYDRIVSYFEDEVLDYKTYRNKEGKAEAQMYPEGHRYAGLQIVENKKDKFVTGAKKYLNDISMNAMLTDLMVASSDERVLNLDEFLLNGGVLLVNTALGHLQELSLMFGQFFIRQFQSAVFRRPRETDDYKRIPTFFSIDEFPLYINESFERLLTLGRSYKVGTLVAVQSLGQIEKVIQGYDKVIMANASSKTVFGRGVYDDNERFSLQFGEEVRVEESLNESTTPVTVENTQWGYRHNSQRKQLPRFTPTEISELPFKHMIVQIVEEDGSIGKATLATGKFVNETKFLKKYIDLDSIELSTKKLKDISIDGPTVSSEPPGEETPLLNVEENVKQENKVDDILVEFNSDPEEVILEDFIPLEFDVSATEEEEDVNPIIETTQPKEEQRKEINKEIPTYKHSVPSKEFDDNVDVLFETINKSINELKPIQKIDEVVEDDLMN